MIESWIESVNINDINNVTILVRLLLAVICGGALGFERMRKLRPAGLRTYMMVFLGACITMMTGQFVSQTLNTGDPTRMAAQVISGIGFIGAGTIMLTGNNHIKGLTTAAGLWANAAMGLAIGAGMYTGALIIVTVLLMTVTLGSKFQEFFLSRNNRIRFFLLLENEENLKKLLGALQQHEMKVNEFEARTVIGSSVGLALTLDLPEKMSHTVAMKIIDECSVTAFLEEI